MRENTDQKKNRYLDTFYAVTNLATTGALTAVKNKMPSVSNLILVQKKTDYNTKLIKFKRKLLIIIMINMLLLQYLKSDFHLPIVFMLFASLKALYNDKKCFFFHLKNSFRSQDV